jgi:hypothetical protein
VNPFVKIAEGNGQEDVWFQKTAASAANSGNGTPVISISADQTATQIPAKVVNPIITKSFFASYSKKDSSFGSSSATKGNNNNDDSYCSDKDNSDDDNDRGAETDNEADNANDEISSRKIIQLPDSVVVVTGEEEEECLVEIRAKLYRWANKISQTPSDAHIHSKPSNSIVDSSVASSLTNGSSDAQNYEWIEVGVGPIRLLRERSASIIPSKLPSSENTVEETSSTSVSITDGAGNNKSNDNNNTTEFSILDLISNSETLLVKVSLQNGETVTKKIFHQLLNRFNIF